MVTTSEIILAIIIVTLSLSCLFIITIKERKTPSKIINLQISPEIKNYIDRINEITRTKRK